MPWRCILQGWSSDGTTHRNRRGQCTWPRGYRQADGAAETWALRSRPSADSAVEEGLGRRGLAGGSPGLHPELRVSRKHGTEGRCHRASLLWLL